MKSGVAMTQAEVEDMNAQLRELQKDLPVDEQVLYYDYDQLYPTKVGDTPTADNHVFHSASARELQTLNGTKIRYNSLLVESCVSGKLWRAGKADMCAASECLSGRVHRFREIVLFHGEQIYPEYLIAYKRIAQKSPVEFVNVDKSGKRWDYSTTDSALIADARERQLSSVKLVDAKGFEVQLDFTAVAANAGGGVTDSPPSRKRKAKKRGAASSRTGMMQVNLDNGKRRVVEEKGTERD
jgi:hypothetical protein